MFNMASRFNHECAPNIGSKIVEGKFLAELQRDVEDGEELTVTYIYNDSRPSANELRKQLEAWGFECNCPPCVAGAFVTGDNVVEVDQGDLNIDEEV